MSQPRLSARIRTTLLAAVLALVTAAVGGCGLFTAPTSAQPQAASVAPAPPRPTVPAARLAGGYFGALAGYGCPQRPQARFREAGWYADGINGFLGVSAGGWDHQGCDGRFGAMPMSGSAIRPDPGNYAMWTFRTAPVTAGTCQIAVYVPADPSVEHVGGDPARYQVYDSATASGPAAGSFTIGELARRGQWVSGGSYRLTRGVLAVKLISSGLDWHGNVVTHAHLPVTQVMVFCNR